MATREQNAEHSRVEQLICKYDRYVEPTRAKCCHLSYLHRKGTGLCMECDMAVRRRRAREDDDD